MMRRWVYDGHPESLSALLFDLNDVDAAREGRLFVNGRRTAVDTPVRVGDAIDVASSIEAPGEAAVVARSGALVVVDKPAGLPTEPDRGGSRSVVEQISALLGEAAHAETRLDRDVSGLVLLSLDAAARAIVARAREERALGRRYLGICAGSPSADHGEWSAPIGGAGARGRRRIGGRGARSATTRYRLRAAAPIGPARGPRPALVAFAPVTGRTHQIRAHCADAGIPLMGDRLYGGPARAVLPGGAVVTVTRAALHAQRLVVPMGGSQPWVVDAPLPEDLATAWERLGGNSASWSLGSALDAAAAACE